MLGVELWSEETVDRRRSQSRPPGLESQDDLEARDRYWLNVTMRFT